MYIVSLLPFDCLAPRPSLRVLFRSGGLKGRRKICELSRLIHALLRFYAVPNVAKERSVVRPLLRNFLISPALTITLRGTCVCEDVPTALRPPARLQAQPDKLPLGAIRLFFLRPVSATLVLEKMKTAPSAAPQKMISNISYKYRPIYVYIYI